MIKKILFFSILILIAIYIAVLAPIDVGPGWSRLGFPLEWSTSGISNLGFPEQAPTRNYTNLMVNLLINITVAIIIGFLATMLKRRFSKNK